MSLSIGDIAGLFNSASSLFGGGTKVTNTSSSASNVTVNTSVNPAIVVDTAPLADNLQKLMDSVGAYQKTDQQLKAVAILSDAQNAQLTKQATIGAALIGAFVFLYRRK